MSASTACLIINPPSHQLWLRVALLVVIAMGFSACQGGRGDASRSADSESTTEQEPGSIDSPESQPNPPPPIDAALGCDPIDPAHCLFPFPNNHFTAAATAGSPQSVEAGGTGIHVNFNLLQMPRNVLGKPIDPSEWNRNDGFSPGAMILTLVPGLAANPDGSVPGAVSLSRLSDYLAQDARVIVFNAQTGERQPIWAEVDLNAGFFQPSDELGQPIPYLDGRDPQAALIIRPARNFEEGQRYIVALRGLTDAEGKTIPASTSFSACRDKAPLATDFLDRCSSLETQVFSVLPADIAREELFLAWDFTVASEKGLAGRLLHIRDDAFASLGESINILPGDAGYVQGASPSFSIESVIDNPREGIARRIEGSITIPSYLVPIDASPLEGMRDTLGSIFGQFPDALKPAKDACNDISPLGEACLIFDPAEAVEFAASVSIPPNRFFYNPTDSIGDLYGDGLPDRLTPTASMTRPFICNLPSLANAENPARVSLYGHGLLGTRGEVNSGHVSSMGALHNVMFCAVDWFGFSSGDLVNVVLILLDASNFPMLGDSAQQGMLNMMFLARAMIHPEGFAAHPAFQNSEGQSLLDTREVYFDGNSQGGIMGGAVVAASRDVNRGVLGVPGMNYSTLLRRSVDFDLYSIPLYTAYPDDLDRDLVLSLLEMQWERAENNAYAHHLNTATSSNTPLPNSPDSRIMLHVGYSDHQVTMWSADVMARTLHAPLDRAGLDRNPLELNPEGSDRHPDEQEYVLLDDLNNAEGAHFENGSYDGSALVIWDEPWDASEPETRCVDNHTESAPHGNVPPRNTGDDPHECPRREPGARCQKSHFLQPNGRVIDVSQVHKDADCPALNN